MPGFFYSETNCTVSFFRKITNISMAPVSGLELTSTKIFFKYFATFGVHLLSDKQLKNRSTLRSYVIVIAGFIQMILAIVLSIKKWNYINIRVAAFTKFGEYSICTVALGHLVIFPEQCVELFSLIDKPLDNFSKYWSQEQLFIRNDANRRAKTIQKLYFSAGIMLWLFTNFLPFITETGKLIIKPLNNISEDELTVSFYFLPYLSVNTVPIYLILSLIQSLLYLIMIATTAIYYSVVTTAIKMLEAEVKILCVSIRIIGDNMSNELKNKSNTYDSISPEVLLKVNLKYLIQHHQAIMNAVKKLNEVASFLLLAFNGIVTAQLSLELFCTLETDDPWMHFLRIPGSVVCYGVICFLGQGLINEADNLKREVENFPWVDTPIWFKKSLLTVVTCLKKPLEIKLSSLYVLNARNLMSVVHAAYSYLNMMRSFKANKGF